MIARQSVTDPQVRDRPRRSGHPQALPVYVSLYEPVGRRTWWWYSYRCPHCRQYQLGRAKCIERVPGERRAGCGHPIRVNVARVYGQPGGAA